MKIPRQLPVLSEILDRVNIEALELVLTSNVKVSQDGQYRHWDEIRYRNSPQAYRERSGGLPSSTRGSESLTICL